MALNPIEIRREPEFGLTIAWSDGNKTRIPKEALRKMCPCASCREARGDESHASPLAPKKSSLLKVIEHTRDQELELKEIWAIGNYALGIEWGDGHNTGIYTYEYLQSLANAPTANL